MAAKLAIAPEAELDLAEAYVWYESRRIGLGEEFSVENYLDRIEALLPGNAQASAGSGSIFGMWVSLKDPGHFMDRMLTSAREQPRWFGRFAARARRTAKIS